jgi:Heparinase II/III N-terminus/Heparinase II/III-like protein
VRVRLHASLPVEPRVKRRTLYRFSAGLILALAPLVCLGEPQTEWEPIIPVLAPANQAQLAEADLALNDTFTLQGVQAVARRQATGGFDWTYQGPRNDPEWAWFFNRHSYFVPLVQAYVRTHDERYPEFLFNTLDDWITQHPAPGRISFSAAWRPLEAARRILDSWTFVYLKLGDHPAFTQERRARFLASVYAHGEQLRHHHALYGNHLITEMLALAQLSLVFKQHGDCAEWLNYSLEQLDKNYTEQVYPDGAFKELSAHYQRVVALNYQDLLTLLETSGRNDLADAWRPRVNKLWTYLASIIQPDGGNPLNNDSDQENLLNLLQANAPDLAVNETATCWLPYAGQAVFRSPGTAKTPALWAFFDTGPRGTDHDHADRLHLSVSVGPREFLVDNGRYTYAPGPWRDYFAGPTGHNVILFDGQGSDQGPAKVDEPNVLGHFFAKAEIEVAYGDAAFATVANPRAGDWRRIVVHLRNTGWIVVDRIVAFQPTTLSTQWHWHPNCDVLPADPLKGQFIRNGPSSVQLQIASNAPTGNWQVIRGSDQPVQGWYSERFNSKAPAACTLYNQAVQRPVINVWLITPRDEKSPAAQFAVTFETTGQLVIRAQFACGEQELRLDPEKPEAVTLR